MVYELYYWPGIQGRGEFVRLALEEAGAEYVDVALVPPDEGGGVPALERILSGSDVERPPFAPPFLKAGRRLIGQSANILLFLGGRLGLAPRVGPMPDGKESCRSLFDRPQYTFPTHQSSRRHSVLTTPLTIHIDAVGRSWHAMPLEKMLTPKDEGFGA